MQSAATTLIAWVKLLGHNDCASVLERNLEEEKAAHQKLTNIWESSSGSTRLLAPGGECC
jgi:ferritin-like metal-binding protein YciE